MTKAPTTKAAKTKAATSTATKDEAPPHGTLVEKPKAGRKPNALQQPLQPSLELPSVPMMMRHRPPGSLALRVLKDHLAHAHDTDPDRCRGGRRHERRPEADGGGACLGLT